MTAGRASSADLVHRARAEVGVFKARPDQVGAARRFVAGHLSGHPCRADAELLASELVTNAITHGQEGGADTVTVTLVATEESARMSVADHGPRPPCVCCLGAASDVPDEEIVEGGRGLVLLDEIVLGCGGAWGFRRGQRGTVIWVELRVDEPVQAGESPSVAVGGGIRDVG